VDVVDVAYAIEPSMPKPIVTSDQITAQVSSECQFLAERRSAKINEDHQLGDG